MCFTAKNVSWFFTHHKLVLRPWFSFVPKVVSWIKKLCLPSFFPNPKQLHSSDVNRIEVYKFVLRVWVPFRFDFPHKGTGSFFYPPFLGGLLSSFLRPVIKGKVLPFRSRPISEGMSLLLFAVRWLCAGFLPILLLDFKAFGFVACVAFCVKCFWTTQVVMNMK